MIHQEIIDDIEKCFERQFGKILHLVKLEEKYCYATLLTRMIWSSLSI